MSTFVLRYFNVKSRAEGIKALLTYGGAKWTQEYPEWPADKFKQPMGKVPVLVETTKGSESAPFILSDSLAIEQYLALKYNLYHASDPKSIAVEHEYRNQIKDVHEMIGAVIFSPDALREENKAKLETGLKLLIANHEKVLKENGSNGHYFGGNICYIDIVAAAIINSFRDRLSTVYPAALEMLSKENAPGINKVIEVTFTNAKLEPYVKA